MPLTKHNWISLSFRVGFSNFLTRAPQLVLLVSIVFLFGCAGTSSVKGSLSSYPSGPLAALQRSKPHAVPTRMLKDFHEDNSTSFPSDWRNRIKTNLARFPSHFEVHEAAGFFELLMGNENKAWSHFLQAARDTRSKDTRVYLEEMANTARTIAQYAIEIPFLRQLVATHPDPNIQAYSHFLLSADLKRFGLDKEEPFTPQDYGFIQDWSLIGPFDNGQGKGFLTVYAPEDGYDPHGEYDGSRSSIGWRSIRVTDAIHLDQWVYPVEQSVAYLSSWVWVDNALGASLRISTGSPIRAWLNQTIIVDDAKLAGSSFDNVISKVALKAGWNHLLIKSAHESGDWTLHARFTQDDGASIPGMKSSSKQHPTIKSLANPPPQITVLPLHLQRDASARILFLRTWYFKQFGYTQQALRSAEEAFQKTPHHPLVLFHWSSLLSKNNEDGKAIDLLQNAISNSEDFTPLHYYQRARFFIRKKRWLKGQKDLDEIRKVTQTSLRTEIALSDLYEERGWYLDQYLLLKDLEKRWPSSGWVQRNLAWSLFLLGRESEGFRSLASSVEKEPGHQASHQLLCGKCEKRDQEKALQCYEELVALAPRRIISRLKLAKLEQTMKRFQPAERNLRTVFQQVPGHPKAMQMLGDIFYERGKKEKALGFWTKSLEQNPENPVLTSLVNRLSYDQVQFFDAYAPTDSEIAAAIDNRHQIIPAPGIRSAYLLDHEVTKVNSDGSSQALVTMVQMATNAQGRDDLIKTRIPRSQIKLMQAYTISPDDTRREASSVRSGVIRFRQMEVGSVVVVQFLQNRRAPDFLPNHFFSRWSFQGFQLEHRYSKWVLLIPKDKKLRIAKEGNIKVSTLSKDNYRVHTFESRNAPGLYPEPMMPHPHDIRWNVSVSTLPNWDEYVRWERALLKNAFQKTPQLKELALELTKDAATTKERFNKLFHYVTQEIRYQQDYENTIAGVKPHACPIVVQRGYGDCKDKAVLLRTLGEMVGIDIHFAILRTRNAGRLQEDIPNQQFNHAIVYVPQQKGIDKGFFADPTTDGLDIGNLRHDDQGARALVLNLANGEWNFRDIPYQDASFEVENTHFEIFLHPDGTATADYQVSLRGAQASIIRRALRNQETAQDLYQRIASVYFPGSTLIVGNSHAPENIWAPLKIDTKIDITPSVHPSGDSVRIDTPFLFPLAGVLQLNERQFPLILGIKQRKTLDILIHSVSKQTNIVLPPDFAVSQDCFSLSRTTIREPKGIKIQYLYAQVCPEIPSEDYPSFRQSAQKVLSHHRDPLLLSRPQP